jgi:hypothetical protein
MMIVYEGTETEEAPYTDPLVALEPVTIASNNTAYPGIGALGFLL